MFKRYLTMVSIIFFSFVITGINHTYNEIHYYRARKGHRDLRKADLSGANLNYINLHKRLLTFANLNSAKLRHSRLTELIFRGGSAINADFTGADMRLSDFRAVNFTRAKLDYANLLESNIQRANFRNASFYYTRIDYKYHKILKSFKVKGYKKIKWVNKPLL